MNKILLIAFSLIIFSSRIKGQSPYSIVISEIMADPTPQRSLPDNEWIEIRNTSSQPINLQGWRIRKAASQSGPFPDVSLDPDSMLIICGSSSLTAMQAYGQAVSVTYFPSLSNSGDLLILQSASGNVIHAVEYSDAWYDNEVKNDGGWSLEMRDVHNPCSGQTNWGASTDPSGGTPGRINSINASNPDVLPPNVVSAIFTDSLHAEILFNEPLDSLIASHRSLFSIDPDIGVPDSVIIYPPLFNKISLRFSVPAIASAIYKISVGSVVDCSGNALITPAFIAAGLPEFADSNDIVVNEILFDPLTGGSDYVELYNRSNKIINLKDLLIANRSIIGAPSDPSAVSTDNYLLLPGDYAVVTTNRLSVVRDHDVLYPNKMIEATALPSFPDDEGHVLLMNNSGEIIDEVHYRDGWHYPLISNDENVALERISADRPSSLPSNWHSASADSKYGTPTYKNSQARPDEQEGREIEIIPPVFSPDNDGNDDFTLIRYEFNKPGYTVNIHVFDLSGRPVRYLEKSSLAGVRGFYKWDGLDDKGRALTPGPYIIYTEAFNTEGKVRKFKNSAVIAAMR